MAQFIACLATLAVVGIVVLTGVAYGILLERKIASWVQDRIGPNRVGFAFGQQDLADKVGLGKLARFHFWGLGQPPADGLKMFLKEDYTPPFVDQALFALGPILAIVPALLAWAVMPWGGYLRWGDGALNITGAPVNLGAVVVLAIGSLAVYGVVVAGYASNNKYSFLGSLRATAQMLSYEIPIGLCVLVIGLMCASLQPDVIAVVQSGGVWNLIYQPLLAVIFFTAQLAECNRAPFDLAEAEQELVGGYHTEFSSMKLGLLLMSEYLHMITACALFALLFLGGWSVSPLGLWPDLPVVGGIGVVLAKFAVFAGKVFALMALMMLVRWTLPRFRFDQLMKLAWRGLIPLSLGILLLCGLAVFAQTLGWLTRGQSLWAMLGVNVVMGGAMLAGGAILPTGPPVNRRVPLEGSRFSPPTPAS